MTWPETGSAAPDLTLPDQHGSPFTLSDLRGEAAALVVFYPFAFSRVCTGELDALQAESGSLAASGVQVVAISCDPRHALRAWAEQQGFDLPLLSDFWPHGEVARRYGAFSDEVGSPVRASFLVDRDGVLRWSVRSDPGRARPVAAYRAAVAALQDPPGCLAPSRPRPSG